MTRTALLPAHPNNPYPTGRHVEHDPQSRSHPFTSVGPVSYHTTLWPTCPTILNQRNLGACVGFTGADVLNTGIFTRLRSKMNARRLYHDKDGIRFYHLATEADDVDGAYPPDDTGSTGLGLAKALKTLGLIDSYTHVFGFDHFREAIASGPVAVGTRWTTPMFTPDRDGLVHPGDLSNPVGGHEYMVRGINYETRRVRARNHWAQSWGLAGEFEIGFDDFAALLAAEGDVTVLHPATV